MCISDIFFLTVKKEMPLKRRKKMIIRNHPKLKIVTLKVMTPTIRKMTMITLMKLYNMQTIFLRKL